MVSDDAMNQSRLKTLGICWIVYGIIRLVAAAWLASFSGTATLMYGSLLNRVADPFALMNIFHFMYTLVVVLSILCAVLGMVAGIALVTGHKFGETTAIVVAFLSLCDIPLGLTLGTYSLIVLLPTHAAHASSVAEPSSRLRRYPSTT